MNHQDHVNLLRKGISQSAGIWADLGAGTGAFTLALAELIGPTGTIYAVDKNGRDLQALTQSMQRRFPRITIHTIQADFTRPLPLPLLDGLVMANSLHFVRQKAEVVRQAKQYLGENGRFLLVEYNTEQGNPWVPYPLTYEMWVQLAQQCGFNHTEPCATYPSRFLHEIYAAASW